MSEIVVTQNGVYETPQASTLANPSTWLMDALTVGGRQSDGGVPVTWKSVCGQSTAWYCLNRISSDVAQLPLRLYAREDGQSDEDTSHPAGKLMRVGVSSVVDPFHLRKLLTFHAALHGNGRAYISRNGRGEPIDLLPLPFDRVSTVVMHDTILGTRRKYHVLWPESPDDVSPVPIDDEDVLHIYGQSNDGYTGLSLLDVLRNCFGEAVASQKVTNSFFKNNAVPGIVLEAPPGVFRKEEDAQAFIRAWNDFHGGANNAGKAGLLREGVKANVLTQSFRDAQIEELKRFSVAEIMRVFAMPVVPGMTDSTSYNTLEQLNRAYLLHCLGPWLKIWETECTRKLLTQRELVSEAWWFEFDTWDLVKPDAASRATMIANLVRSMIITPNEARDWESLPPIEGGDKLVNPATTKNGGQQQQKNSSNSDNTIADSAHDSQQTDQQTQQKVELAYARLLPVVRAEARRVAEMASKARNFTEWQEAYYVKHQARMVEVVSSIGGPAWTATEYCEHSQSLLTNIASTCTSDTFAKTIDAETATWDKRAKELAQTIVETTVNG